MAWEIIRQLKQKQHSVVVASSDPAKLVNDPMFAQVDCVDNTSILQDNFMQNIDIVVHTAFCRKSLGSELMKSLQFSQKVFQRAVETGIKGFINVSSQSVYGSNKKSVPAEDGMYAPGYMYALAKSASELLLETIAQGTNMTYTSVRLASLVGPSKNVPVNILYKFIESALHGKDIVIQGGKQEFSFLDVRDAAEAIIRITELPLERWCPIFNLGPKSRINIVKLAEKAAEYAFQQTGVNVQIHLNEDDTFIHAGMNSDKLYSVLDWTPKFSINDTIVCTGEYIQRRNENA